MTTFAGYETTSDDDLSLSPLSSPDRSWSDDSIPAQDDGDSFGRGAIYGADINSDKLLSAGNETQCSCCRGNCRCHEANEDVPVLFGACGNSNRQIGDDAIMTPSRSTREKIAKVAMNGKTCNMFETATDLSDTSSSSSPRCGGSDGRRKKRMRMISEMHSGIMNDEEDCEGEDPLLHVMDMIEDEIDEHTTDLLPLQVKLLLEQNVFGWSHLASDIIGHVLFTAAAALLTYHVLTWLLLRNTSHPALQWYRRHRNYVPDDNLRGDGDSRVQPILSMTMELFVMIRTMVTVMAALSAFRTVRRRRRVWLHSAYGTRAYEQDHARRELSLREVDRTTILGRIGNSVRVGRNVLKARRVRKKLRKAHSRFERKHAKQQHRGRRLQALGADASGQTSSRDDILMNMVEPRSDAVTGKRQAVGISSEPLTMSVCKDQVRINEIKHLPYAHGGFFGAAPFMLADPIWVNILRELMPDVYVEVARRIFAPTPKLIHWAENNPVVAAYGSVHEKCAHGRITTLEWDVFLDPYLVHRLMAAVRALEEFDSIALQKRTKTDRDDREHGDEVDFKMARKALRREVRRRTILLLEKMLIAHGSLTQLMLEQTGKLKRYNFSRVKRQRRTLGGGIFARQWLAVYARALQMGSGTCSITDVEEDHVDVATMHSEESSCDRSASTDTPSHIRPPSKKVSRATSLRSAGLCPPTNLVESIELVRQNMGAPLGLVLDIKSRHVPHVVWALLVDVLRDCGAHVEGVASFIPSEIRGVSNLCATPVKEVFFFHSAGDMQCACHSGQIRQGDTVFFNAGSLLWDQLPSTIDVVKNSLFLSRFCPLDTRKSYSFQPYAFVKQNKKATTETEEQRQFFPFHRTLIMDDNSVTCTVADYKRQYDLNIGLYCQEFAIDETAIDLLVSFVNAHPDIYNLGLSWGGVNGYTVRGIQPGRFTNTDGFWNQRYAGMRWNGHLSPGESEMQEGIALLPINQGTAGQSKADELRGTSISPNEIRPVNRHLESFG